MLMPCVGLAAVIAAIGYPWFAAGLAAICWSTYTLGRFHGEDDLLRRIKEASDGE